MSEGICKGCAARIIWKKLSNGKSVPLDARGVVYSVVGDTAVKPTPGVAGEVFMVSHFSMCPNANDFSGSKRQSAPSPERHFSEPQGAE